jgi:gamma-glutamylaminecyclotransferase
MVWYQNMHWDLTRLGMKDTMISSSIIHKQEEKPHLLGLSTHQTKKDSKQNSRTIKQKDSLCIHILFFLIAVNRCHIDFVLDLSLEFSVWLLTDCHPVMLVFVYGTLRRGYHNHTYMKGAEFVGPAQTSNKYSLYVDYESSDQQLPRVKLEPQQTTIKGELFRISSFDELDKLEEHPHVYCREQHTFQLSNGEIHNAQMYIYVGDDIKSRIVPSGDFNDIVRHQAGTI